MASLVSVDRDGGRGGRPRKSRKRLSSIGGSSDTPAQAKAKARRKRQKTSEEEALEDLIFDPSFDSVVSTVRNTPVQHWYFCGMFVCFRCSTRVFVLRCATMIVENAELEVIHRFPHARHVKGVDLRSCYV